MTETSDMEGLLLVAVQDLYDGENALGAHLPHLAAVAENDTLASVLTQDVERSRGQAERLASIALQLGGPAQGSENLWMKGILTDARRDSETIRAGALLDIALVGAMRKAKHAERVSYETAIALCDALSLDHPGSLLEQSRQEEDATDKMLERLLYRLSQPG